MIYGQLSWHPQLCKATAVFCINTKTDVFPQSHPVCAIPALLPAIPSKPSSIFLFRSWEHVVTVGLLDWEWEAIKLIHQSQVRRHRQACSTHSQHYLRDIITLSDFFLGKAPNWESCQGSKEAKEVNAVRGRQNHSMGWDNSPWLLGSLCSRHIQDIFFINRGKGSFQNDAMTWLSRARAKGYQQNGNRTTDLTAGEDFQHPCPVLEQPTPI